MHGMSRRGGFSLLEVMIATAVLAVGTVSVLMVFGTALSFAHRRQGQQQLTQVLEEARAEARAMVNAHRPAGATSSSGRTGRSASSKAPAAGKATPAGAEAETAPKQSTVFAAYSYQVRFEPVQREIPEAGWRTTVTVRWGEGQEYRETLVVTPDAIPDEEFAYSATFEDERRGQDDAKTKKETR